MNKTVNQTLRENVLHAKLMPPRLHSSAVQRDELLGRLDNCLSKKSTLVTAPTGFGKTTLISMWIANRDFASAWVTFDANDNDPSRFWNYIVLALRTFDSSIGKNTLSTLMTSQLPTFQTLLTPLINDLAKLKEPGVLVLEDYHSITSREINDGVSFLIQHLPDSLHLLIVTRTNPELSLSLLRARDELIELNTNDLRFNSQETESFLRATIQNELPRSAIDNLTQKTEGWIAGLRLAALSLQNKNAEETEKFIRTFSGSHRYIADYLIKEVFESQSAAVQDFLLKTCFLTSLTVSLCDTITETNNSAALLEQLERDNLFIVQLERSGDQIWHRYNPLFAESIQYLARQRFDETTLQLLFKRASDWYEYHGLFEDAIETTLSAKLFEDAPSLIEKYVEIHDLREMLTLSRWLQIIPQQEVLRHPIICFTYAQIILYSSDRFALATAGRIEPYLHVAESAWRAKENHQNLGQLLSFRGNVAWWHGNLQKAFEYARESLNELPEHDVFWRGNSLLILGYEALNEGRILDAQDVILEARALLGASQNIFGVLAAIQILGEIFYLQGELEQAEQLNQQVLAEAVGDESMLDDQGIASLNLAHIAYERNELEQAAQFATRAFELGEKRGNEMLQVQATIQLAQLHSAGNDSPRARDILKSLEAKIRDTTLLRNLQDAQTLLAIRANDISSLAWWVKIISAENQNSLHLQKESEAFILARLKIAEGKANEALDLLNEWKADAAENGRVQSQIEGLILEALAQHADSNLAKAAKPLFEALTLGQAKGFRRTFLDEGIRMAGLLQATLSTLPNRTLSLFATTLLHSFPEMMPFGGATSSKVQIEALSQQESRVLRLLAAGLSNADMAQELVVSTNTIKTHVKSIYRKLNVKSRDEVREVAHELKLL